MDVRILGPLEVRDGGRVVELRGRRQQALFADLVLHANEVVPVDRLLDDLWGDDQPASGPTALRMQVSRLRQALGGKGLETRAPGYVLQVGADEVDAERFERLLEQGRRERATDPVAASVTLGEALELWRGDVLPELADEPFVRAEARRLDELRLAALEERIAADLELGRHAELVGELEGLVAREPLHERFRAQLMLALYRGGRQADALAVYRQARAVLVDDLGIDPGPELQELERAILRQDPELSLALPPRADGEAPVVRARGERKLVTILAVVVGLPDPDPERTVAAIERLRSFLGDAVEELGGRIESVLGDTFVASFGAPVAQEDHAERAVHAALSVRRRLERHEHEVRSIRIGLATGQVMVDQGREDGGLVSGRVIARAAWYAKSADPGTIRAGERTSAAVHHAFELGPLIDLQLDAPGGARCRTVLRELPSPGGGGGTRFVGRDAELATLQAAYRRSVDAGVPQLVTVLGDAGLGKTRLVRELWEWLGEHRSRPVRRIGRCVQLARGMTYRPLAEVLREELGLLASDSPDEVVAALGDRPILGLTLGLDVAGDLHPLAARERLHEAWVSLLTELAAEQPVVVVVEDVHWAHEALLDLVERLLDGVAGPLLVLATARPELVDLRPAWGRRRDATTTWLEPLTESDAVTLLAELGGAGLSDDLRERILARAEGNPFFLEELVAGIPHGFSVDPGEIPDSVHGAIAARLDLLPPAEKEAVQAAAVIGRVFWRGAVRELLGGSVPDFGLLEAREFVRHRPASSLEGEREFVFKHALTRDVALASLTLADRARLHAAFADWLERTGDVRSGLAAVLAFHLEEAARPETADLAWSGEPDRLRELQGRAVVWLDRAAAHATASYELEEAIALLERALALKPAQPVLARLWRAIARANALKFDGDAFWGSMNEAIRLADDDATRADLYSELVFHTGCRSGMWRQMPQQDVVDGWITTALALAEPDSPARARALIARSYWNPFAGSAAAREASAIADALDDPDLRSYAWDARGIAEFVSGRYERGRALAERRFELLDRVTDPDHRADIYAAPISGCIWSGQFEEARRLALLHDDAVTPLTPHHRLHGVAILGEVEEHIGDWERICGLTERTESAAAENATTPCVRNARALLVCAYAHAVLGGAGEAQRLRLQAEALGIDGYGVVLDMPRLRLALLAEDLDEVERLLLTPLPARGWYRGWMALATITTRLDALAALRDRERTEQEAAPHLRPDTYLEPFALRALGIVRGDPVLVAQALERFEALGLAWHTAQTRAVLVVI